MRYNRPDPERLRLNRQGHTWDRIKSGHRTRHGPQADASSKPRWVQTPRRGATPTMAPGWWSATSRNGHMHVKGEVGICRLAQRRPSTETNSGTYSGTYSDTCSFTDRPRVVKGSGRYCIVKATRTEIVNPLRQCKRTRREVKELTGYVEM